MFMEDVIMLMNPKHEIHTNLTERLRSVLVPLDNKHRTQELLFVSFPETQNRQKLFTNFLLIKENLCVFSVL